MKRTTTLDHLVDCLFEAFDPRWVESSARPDVQAVVDGLLDLEVKQIWDASKGVIRTRRKRRLGIRFPTSYAVKYKRWIQSHVDGVHEIAQTWVENDLVPALEAHLQERGDAQSNVASSQVAKRDAVDKISDKLDELKNLFYSLATVDALQQQVEDYSRMMLEYSKRSWARSIHQIRKLDPLTNDAALEEILKAHVHENVRLIKSIPEKYFGDVERVVMDGVRKGKGIKEITDEITKVYPSKTAGLIARDQCGSFCGALSREQFNQAGLKTYIWRNMQDERVRGNPMGRFPNAKPSHWDREGKVFAWDEANGEIPSDGHPGFPIACRCWAQVQEEEALYDPENTVQPGEFYDELPESKLLVQPGRPTPSKPKSSASPRSKPVEKDSLETAIAQATADLHRPSKPRVREKCWVIGSGGEVRLTKIGGKHSIEHTADEVRVMRDAIYVHNHPSGVSLSIQDVYFAQRAGIREIRAIGSKYSYSACWEGEMPSKFTWVATAQDIDHALYRKYRVLVNSGKLPPVEASMQHQHELWTEFAEKMKDLGHKFVYRRWLT